MAGHAGKAFWFSKKSGEFVTSTYYYKQYPDWVNKWNERKPALAYAGKSWELLHSPTKYLFGNADDREYETYFPGFGRTFPHPYGKANDKYFTTRLTLSPAGDELTLDFAKALLENEQLGQDEVPDYLAISFSSTDYVGHIFGASSLESEDNIARLDRTLADLFAYIDEKVGLDKTLIVLSADHGQPEVPGYLHERGIDKAHYFDTRSLDKAPAIAALKKQFGMGEELIEAYFHPYLYLNHKLIRAKGLDQAEVENAVAAELLKFKGVDYAVSSTALSTGGLADTPLTRSILSNFHPKRSGDIYLVFEPNVFINDFDGLIVASTHGSPWSYDTYVPVIFTGSGLKSAKVNRAVTPYDVAATLAAYLNVKPPSGNIGTPLVEVLGNSTGWANEAGEKTEASRSRFGLGVAAGLVRFDTNFRFTDKDSGLSVFVDGEGTLGLPEKKGLPVFYGHYRFNKRHGISFNYFRVKRVATLLQVNESKDFNLGDLTITAGANAEVTLTDKSHFYYLSYNYTLFDDNRSYLFASLGLYGLDLTYGLDARGQISLEGIPVIGGSYSREASVFAPLPMFGIDAWYYFTPKWALGTKVSVVGGSYQDISAVVLDTTVRAKYQFAKHVGFTFGITYFNGEVTIDNPELKTEVDYGFDGAALGFDMSF